MDLERYPTNETALRMMAQISPIYDRSWVAKYLFQAMGIELEDAHTRTDDELPLQAFPETATWGLKYWEQLYGIETDETLEIESRRRAVLSRRRIHGQPMNPARVEEILSELTGTLATVEEDIDDYTFQVSFVNGQFDFVKMMEKLDKIKPSHLNYQIAVNPVIEMTTRIGTVLIIKRSVSFGLDTTDYETET